MLPALQKQQKANLYSSLSSECYKARCGQVWDSPVFPATLSGNGCKRKNELLQPNQGVMLSEGTGEQRQSVNQFKGPEVS